MIVIYLTNKPTPTMKCNQTTIQLLYYIQFTLKRQIKRLICGNYHLYCHVVGTAFYSSTSHTISGSHVDEIKIVDVV